MPDIIITVNSPGELYSLVKPAIEKIKAKYKDNRIILVIPPCQYASGRETEIAKSFPEVFEVILPDEYLRWIFKNKKPKELSFSRQGVVVFMGGDLLHAVLLSWKLKYPALAYTCDKIGWKNSFKKFLLPNLRMHRQALRKRIKLDKLKIIGEIMVDAAKPRMSREQAYQFWELNPHLPIITLFAGSREFQYKYLPSFLLKVSEHIKEKRSETQFILSLSPFVPLETIEPYFNPQTQADKIYTEATSLPVKIIKADLYHTYLENPQGLKILIVEGAPYDVLNITDLLLTVPGTNTAEAAALGTPLISIFPFNKPEILPLEGLPDLISRIPLIGIYLKIAAVKIFSKMIRYFALPNLKAQAEIVPEIKGILEPAEVAKVALDLINNPLRLSQTSKRLKEIMGKPGAAEKLAEEIYETLHKTFKIS